MNSTLLPQQQRFVDALLASEDMNASAAARAAGYSPKTAGVQACKLLKHPIVAAAVKKAMDDRAARSQLDADYVLRKLRQEAENPKTTPASRVRALQLLGQHLGIFRPDDMPDNASPPISIVEVMKPPPVPEGAESHVDILRDAVLAETAKQRAEKPPEVVEEPPAVVAQPEKSLPPVSPAAPAKPPGRDHAAYHKQIDDAHLATLRPSRGNEDSRGLAFPSW